LADAANSPGNRPARLAFDERAKGILMQREGLSEEEAFARLRKASQISGRPLKVVAEALVATLGEDAGGKPRRA
jgi:response regulator NasT